MSNDQPEPPALHEPPDGEPLGASVLPFEAPAPDYSTIIARLEDALEQAKRGEITAVAIALTCTDGGVEIAHAFSDDGNRYTLLGAVSWLQQRLLAEADE